MAELIAEVGEYKVSRKRGRFVCSCWGWRAYHNKYPVCHHILMALSKTYYRMESASVYSAAVPFVCFWQTDGKRVILFPPQSSEYSEDFVCSVVYDLFRAGAPKEIARGYLADSLKRSASSSISLVLERGVRQYGTLSIPYWTHIPVMVCKENCNYYFVHMGGDGKNIELGMVVSSAGEASVLSVLRTDIGNLPTEARDFWGDNLVFWKQLSVNLPGNMRVPAFVSRVSLK